MFRIGLSVRHAILILLLLATALSAEVRPAGIFGDHMVLQRQMKLPIWGWAAAGEPVAVSLGDQTVKTTADAEGRWHIILEPMQAGGPYELTVTGSNMITLRDVLIGEVWICSGQSNMELSMPYIADADSEIKAAHYPQIRQLKVTRHASVVALDDVAGQWAVCSPQTAPEFTAVGYFAARRLQQELHVPIGIINSTWGGSCTEPWTPLTGFETIDALSWFVRDAKQRAADSKPGDKVDFQRPTVLYNGMIRGLEPCAMRGVFWYQGESNAGEGMGHLNKMRALIGGWRAAWGVGDFPFYFVQLAPYKYREDDPYMLPRFWEAQAAVARDIPNTAMVVINDIGMLNDIHPRNKQDVGLRLANVALKRTYSRSDIIDTGPTFKQFDRAGSQLRITFDNTAGGLRWRDNTPGDSFEIAGADGQWHRARANIDGDCVVLSSDQVSTPVAVRFAWHQFAEPTLVNGAGLPTGAFRAGELPKYTVQSGRITR